MTAVELVNRVIEALNGHNVPYMVVGSFSSNVYGLPRATKDADIVVQLSDQDISSLARTLGPDFTLDPQMSFETVTSTMRYRLFHKDSRFLVELFLLSTDAHDQSRFARRMKVDMGGYTAMMPTAEDVIITKLRWSRQGQRSKDVLDVKGVLRVQKGKLDLGYVRRWANDHGTADLFETLLAEAGG